MFNLEQLLISLNTPLAIALLSLVGAAVLYQIYFYLRYINQGGKSSKVILKNTTPDYPPVSVIICARNEYENLQDYLAVILSQDYPCYEVIVVDDSSDDETDLLLERLSRQHANLYHTFVPRGARILSSKKLALTIGIKAAKYEHLLLTDADCRPESKNWIREMMQGFANENTEVVVGFSPYFEKKGLLNHIISYDTLFSGLQYMGMARSGHPYMGVGRNLAYKRSTFFNIGGFKTLINNLAGDDDLFVNRVATRKNTTVVCNKDSLVWSQPKTTWHEWLHQKHRHLSVSPKYRLGSKLRLTIEPMTRALLYLSLLACILWGGYVVTAVAVALFLLRCLVQRCVINAATRRLGLRKIGVGLWIYDIIMPLITLYILFTQRFKKRALYW
mgnify:FL=1